MSKMTECKTCGNQIASNAKACPNCGAKIKKPIYKKWWFWFLIVVILLVLVTNISSGSDDNDDAQTTTTPTSSTETTAPAKKELWVKEYYVDEFNQETDEWYIINKTPFVGTFSNSATTDSGLTAEILVDAENTAIVLYEYTRSMVKNSYSDANEYTIVMKAQNGEKHEMKGYMYSDGDRIIIDSKDQQIVKNALKGKENVSFYIYDTDRSVTNYLFVAIPSNFAELVK